MASATATQINRPITWRVSSGLVLDKGSRLRIAPTEIGPFAEFFAPADSQTFAEGHVSSQGAPGPFPTHCDRPRRFGPAKPNSSRSSTLPAGGHGAARGRPCAVVVAIPSNRTPSARSNMGTEDNNPLQTVTYGRKIYSDLHTVIIRPRDGLSLAKTRPAQAMQSLAAAARLTPTEVREAALSVQTRSNLLIFKTFRQTAMTKVLQLESLSIGDATYGVAAYPAAPADSCKGVIHG
ncbi:hypothetical protein HPB47_018300, partial [Ixodes persulcatus]